MQIADHLRQLEEQLLQPLVRQDPALLSSLIADDFVEFGASGRVYDKATVLSALASEPHGSTIHCSDFKVRPLAETVVLVTFRTTRNHPSGQPTAAVQRSSVWVHREARWQVTFHQGTPLS